MKCIFTGPGPFSARRVTITVSQDGATIGSAVSDASGDWRVEVPGPGVYQVELDVSTGELRVLTAHDPDPTVLRRPNGEEEVDGERSRGEEP